MADWFDTSRQLDVTRRKRLISVDLILRRNVDGGQLERLRLDHDQIVETLSELRRVRLDRESLTHIDGLELCSRITHLYLHHNFISRLENLDFLQCLSFLSVSHNLIEQVENISELPSLTFLDISHNRISMLDVDQLPASIISLDYRGNPCSDDTTTRSKIEQLLPRLTMVNCCPVVAVNTDDESDSEEPPVLSCMPVEAHQDDVVKSIDYSLGPAITSLLRPIVRPASATIDAAESLDRPFSRHKVVPQISGSRPQSSNETGSIDQVANAVIDVLSDSQKRLQDDLKLSCERLERERLRSAPGSSSRFQNGRSKTISPLPPSMKPQTMRKTRKSQFVQSIPAEPLVLTDSTKKSASSANKVDEALMELEQFLGENSCVSRLRDGLATPPITLLDISEFEP